MRPPNRKSALVLAALMAGGPLFAADGPGDAHRYEQLYEQIYVREKGTLPKRGVAERLCFSSVAVRLAQQTGSPEHLDTAVSVLKATLPAAARSASDFHVQRGIGLAILPLQRLGLVQPGDAEALRPIATKVWKEFLALHDGYADNNIRLAQAFGCAAFVTFFKDDRTLDSAPIRERLEQYWAGIKAAGDLDEDASNYSGLGIVHCIELAQLLGHEEDLRSPGFRRMFERQRDLISPTGRLPEFGDSYFHPGRDAFDYLFICEYAAALFEDPTYLAVARRLFDPVTFAAAVPDQWCRGISLLDLARSTRPPAPAPAGSLVNYRAIRGQAQPVVDKMILRTGAEPGDAMVLLDLYAAGSHAHRAKGPSVAYYEADGVPLFHNLGRHGARSAITGNSFWALEDGCAFPGIWKPDEWFTMTIPGEMLDHDASGAPRVGERISFRNFGNRGTRQLWFDNLRLEGRAGVRLLDGFESAKPWHANISSAPGIRVVTSPDHTEGKASQAVNWGVLKAGVGARMLADAPPCTFDPGAFDALKLDLKYSGVRPYLHVRDLCQQVDLGDHSLPYAVGSARAEQRGRDAFGEVVFSRYIAADAQLTRRIVLTAEGCLVIHDRWSPGRTRPKWTAGQLWQLYALAERGPDWFCGEDDGAYGVPDARSGMRSVTRRMLVKFATNPRTAAFVEQNEQPHHAPNPRKRPADRFYTTGSRRTVVQGGEESFTLVVVPHDPGCDAQALADAIRFAERPEGVDITLDPPASSASVRIRLSGAGGWEVARKTLPAHGAL